MTCSPSSSCHATSTKGSRSRRVCDEATHLTLSRERAQTIAHELETRGVTPAIVDGFGEALPVASNPTDAGRERNRRAEVWLRE